MENTTTSDTTNASPDPKPHDRRAETSPENGAKSKGPKTEAGKKKSAANSFKHGLYARDIVLATEKQSEYDDLQQAFLESFAPANLEEHELVIDMVNARWRMRRVERHEQGLLNLEMSRALRDAPSEFEAMDAVTLEALAIQRLSATPALENINRMAQRFERTYFRCREALLKLQRARGAAEPEPTAEPAPAAVRDEPISAPPPPAPPPRAAGWRRWFPVLAMFVLFVVRFAVDSRHFAVLSAPAAPFHNRR
ncbi:MAG: hypothetical protein JNK87_19665 [Bryobacterales bacterium]|nr:hypothetical protein [Bryobacterales bacterium]